MKRPIIIGLLATALLLVCAGIGAVIFFTVSNGFPTNNPFDHNNISSSLEENKTLKVDSEKPITLKVDSMAGDVSVTGADVNSVEVKVIKTAYDSTQTRADEEVKGIKYTVEQNGNAITIKYELPKSSNFSNKINTVDFIITVPVETTVNVDTNGEVSISGTKGDADLKSDFGDLTVENLHGGLKVDTTNGRISITGVDATGKNIKIESDFGDVTLEQIKCQDIDLKSTNGDLTTMNLRATGDVYTKSDFGDITFKNGSAGTFTLDSSNGKIEINKFDVRKLLSVDNSFGDIDLISANAGDYDIHTNNGNLSIDGIKGHLKADTGFGNMEVVNAASAVLDIHTNNGNVDFKGTLGEGSHTIKTDFGDVTLSLPADSNLNVKFKTSFGNITSEIPVTVTLTGQINNNEQNGVMNEGGGLLSIETNNGNITIKAAP